MGEQTLRGVHTLKGGDKLKTLQDTKTRSMYQSCLAISRPYKFLKCNFEAIKVGSFSSKITIFTRQFDLNGSKSKILVTGLWPRVKITFFGFIGLFRW